MTFKDGEPTGENCQVCSEPLYYEMSFIDCFSQSSGHYTKDYPIVICKKCEDNIPYDREFEDIYVQDYGDERK